MAGKWARQEADMAAVRGLREHHRVADLVGPRKRMRRHEWVVPGIEDKGRHGNAGEPWLARRAAPVILGTVESVQRRGHHVVEVVHRFHAPYLAVIQRLRK